MRAELREAGRRLRKMGPRVCCECRGRLRPAERVELEAIEEILWEMELPSDVWGHALSAAKLCVDCGHVTVLTVGGEGATSVLAVWCPGFGLHRRVVATMN